MGINAGLRYAVAWIIIKVFVKAAAWTATALTFVALGVTMAALWFSPELQKHETIRLLKALAEKPSEDD